MKKSTIIGFVLLAAVAVLVGYYLSEKKDASKNPGNVGGGGAVKNRGVLSFVNLNTTTDYKVYTFQEGPDIDTADVHISYDPEQDARGQLELRFQVSDDGTTYYDYNGFATSSAQLIGATSTPYIIAPALTTTSTKEFLLKDLNLNYLRMTVNRATVSGSTSLSNGNFQGEIIFKATNGN